MNSYRILKFFFSIFAMFILAGLLFVRPSDASPKRTPEETRGDLEIISMLSEFRAKLIIDWTTFLKKGSDFGYDRADHDYRPTDTRAEIVLEILKPMLEKSPPEETLAIENLLQTHRRIRDIEKEYIIISEKIRAAITQNFLLLLEMLDVKQVVRDRTSALFFGNPEMIPISELPASQNEDGLKPDYEILKKYGFRPEIDVEWKIHLQSISPKADGNLSPNLSPAPMDKNPERPNRKIPLDSPVPPKKTSASNDHEALRLAFKAHQAADSLYFSLKEMTEESQLIYYGYDHYSTSLKFKYNPEYVKQQLTDLMHLPGLTDLQREKLTGLPKIFEIAEKNSQDFSDHVLKRRKIVFDLEEEVDSALSQIDNLRSFYINRLWEANLEN